MRNNMEATFRYRRAIADATQRYTASLKQIFLVHGCPIPPSPECAGAMGNAWGTWRVAVAAADRELNMVRAGANT